MNYIRFLNVGLLRNVFSIIWPVSDHNPKLSMRIAKGTGESPLNCVMITFDSIDCTYLDQDPFVGDQDEACFPLKAPSCLLPVDQLLVLDASLET